MEVINVKENHLNVSIKKVEKNLVKVFLIVKLDSYHKGI